MNSSNVKYISVSSPHTYNMNNIHVPPKVLVPPVFQAASWERASGRDGSSASSSDDSQESDSKSLAEERQYQLGLQQRILENEGLVGLDPDEILQDDSLEEDSLEEMSSGEKGAGHGTNKEGKQKNHGSGSSPAASCGTSHFTEMEQHQPGISGLREDFADKWLWSLLPPALPQVQGGSQGDSGRAEGNPRKMRRSNSEGSLLPMEKQNQPRASKKVCSSKFYFDLNMKLGGLGPDYEAIKEKKQKLKLQKEYSRQINEYNMKNIVVVQRLPAKPQVSSVSRQKALEYAKKIPKPKTFITRQPDQEVKEERVLPQAPAGTSLPQIPSLESLWNRHEKEKEVVAAFKALHIL